MTDEANIEGGDAPAGGDNGLAPGGSGGEQAQADWRTAISDEKLRSSVDKYTSLDEFARAHNHLQGQLKQRIRLPGANASDEEINKFRKVIGVPENYGDYSVTLPEGAELDQDDLEFVEAFKPIAYRHHIPAAAFSEFVSELAQVGLQKRDNIIGEIRGARQEAEKALEKEWGAEKGRHIEMAKRASRMHGGDDFVEFLNTTKIDGGGVIGDHPAIVKFLAGIGSKSDEHDMLLASTVQEKQSAQARIDQIMEQHPPGSAGYMNPNIQRELQELFKKAAGDKPIVGAAR